MYSESNYALFMVIIFLIEHITSGITYMELGNIQSKREF